MPGSIGPGNRRVCPRVVGVEDVWKDLGFRNMTLSFPGAVESFPGAVEPRRWSKGKLSPSAGSITPNQSAISRWSWGFSTVRGGIDPGDDRFRPRVVGVLVIKKEFYLRMRHYPPRVRCDFDVRQRGSSSRALALRAQTNQRSADRGGAFTPCGAVSDRGIAVFSHGCWS